MKKKWIAIVGATACIWPMIDNYSRAIPLGRSTASELWLPFLWHFSIATIAFVFFVKFILDAMKFSGAVAPDETRNWMERIRGAGAIRLDAFRAQDSDGKPFASYHLTDERHDKSR